MFENNEWMFVCLFSFVFADVKIDWRNQRLSIGWEHFFFSGSVGSHQCDQMARLIFKLWPFGTIKICPNVPKYLQDFGKCYVDTSKFDQKLLNFRKVAKFRHIWSPWSGRRWSACFCLVFVTLNNGGREQRLWLLG